MREELQHMVCKGDSLVFGYMTMTRAPNSGNDTYFCFDTLRVVRVVSGTANWRIGEKTYPLRPDDVVILNNLEPRALQDDEYGGGYPLVLEIYAFSPEAVRYEEECLQPFFGRTSRFENILHGDEEILWILRALRREMTTVDHSSVLLGALVTHLCIALKREIERTQPGALSELDKSHSNNMLIAARTAAYIQTHLSDDLSVESLAGYFHLSTGYFSKLFRERLGVSINTFVNRCRVEEVIRLLRVSNGDVLRTAFQCGFRSSSGFYRAFRAETGRSPLSYTRKKKPE